MSTSICAAAGEVSGAWLTDRRPSLLGLLIYINVEDVQRALEKIVEAGGEIVAPLNSAGEGEAFATFRDPAGNVLGVFHEIGAGHIGSWVRLKSF